ncbi:MAG: DUF4825 domain-containing protein [Clostridia bacterium]|nr:DUF4825 domain-containing protein [Clostridia bacterium]
MKNDLSCEVVQDLLPSYVDELTNEVTNQSVEKHIEHCTNCGEILKRMKEEEISEMKTQKQDIDFLKKTRQKTKLHIFLVALIVGFVVIAVALINAFLIGKDIGNPDLVQVEAMVMNGQIMLKGNLKDSGRGIAEVKIDDEDGIVHVTVSATKQSSFHKNYFHVNYETTTVVSQIWLGDRILWDNGDPISEEVSKLYNSKHPYIGNMPENAESALALGIREDIGNYTNELQTKNAPYGWKMIGKQDYAPESQRKVEIQMKAYASALISVIDNLGYVTFEYTVDGEQYLLTFTEKDADMLAGQSVKNMAKTPCGLQELMKILNLSDGYIGNRIVKYSRSSDGTWSCEGYDYQYRLVLTGRDPNASSDGRYVVLTNDANLTYDKVSWSILSSNSKDWLDPEETVIVEIGGN